MPDLLLSLSRKPMNSRAPSGSKKKSKVNAKSLLGVLSLGIVKGTDISIGAEGPDEEAAVLALQQLIETDFKEFAN